MLPNGDMDPSTLRTLAAVLTVAHDLICSALLFVIVILQVRQHWENVTRLRNLDDHLHRIEKHHIEGK